MSNPLRDQDWRVLLSRIAKGKVTPVIGDGALDSVRIAQKWARDYDYPLADAANLPRVAQFVAVNQSDPLVPKEELLDLLRREPPLDPNAPNDIHNVLAALPMPVYLTTNYDSLMTKALEAKNKRPRRELCRWNDALKSQPSVFDAAEGFEPDATNPLVYHLYGHDELPESLVLTEDDHLDYLVKVSVGNRLPPRIRRALAGTSLLFLGYSLDSLTFRVLFRGIIHSVEGKIPTLNVAVQMPPDSSTYMDYLKNYHEVFPDVQVRTTVYWGTLQEFARELDERWRNFRDDQ